MRRDGIERRLTDSLETALRLAEGVAEVELVAATARMRATRGRDASPSPSTWPARCGPSPSRSWRPGTSPSTRPTAPASTATASAPASRSTPSWSCPTPTCRSTRAPSRPWSTARTQYFQRLLDAVAEANGIDLDKPWAKLTKAQQNVLLYGVKGNVKVKYKNRYGRQRQFSTAYEGVIPYLQRRHQTSESDCPGEQIEGYMREVPCPDCGGARLKPLTLAVTVGGKNISELCDLSIGEAAKFLAALELSERDRLIAERVVKEVNARMGFLLDVGLDYLTLARSAGTLAGGEAQRIRLASQIGSGLVGVLYVLDEPSIGLHQRDNHRLIDTLMRLRDLGNTVLVVEHDEDTIKVAD